MHHVNDFLCIAHQKNFVRIPEDLRYPDGEGVSELNDEFRRLLSSCNWHAARAARELGINPSTVSRYVSGSAQPSIPVLRLFSELIGEPLALPGEAQTVTALRDGPRWLEPWEEEVVRILRLIEPKSRQQLVSAIAEIVSVATIHMGRTAKRGGPNLLSQTLTPAERIAEATASALSAKPTSGDPAEPPLSSVPLPSDVRVPSPQGHNPDRPKAKRRTSLES